MPGAGSGHGSAGAPSIPPPAPLLPSPPPCQPVGVPLPPPRARSLSRLYRNDISGTGLKKKRLPAGEPLPSEGDPAARGRAPRGGCRGRAHGGGQPPQRRSKAARCLSLPAYCLRDTAPAFGNAAAAKRRQQEPQNPRQIAGKGGEGSSAEKYTQIWPFLCTSPCLRLVC